MSRFGYEFVNESDDLSNDIIALKNSVEVVESSIISVSNNLANKLNLNGGTMSGAIAMGSQKITGLANGTNSDEVVNKSQLDTKLNLSGGTMSGALAMGGFNLDNVGTVNAVNGVFSGDLTVSGTSAVINVTNLAVNDPLVAIGTGNTVTDAVDLGQFGTYNNSGVKYFSIFRDASDSGVIKVVHGLTVAPSSSIIDLTNSVKSTVQVGTIDCTGVTLNGSSITSDLGKITGITNGTASASKALILNSNSDITSGINALYVNQIYGTIDVRLSNASPNIVVQGTSALIIKNSTNINGPIESLTDRVVFYTDGIIGCSGLQSINSNNITFKDPSLMRGIGVDAGGLNGVTTIDSSNTIAITTSTNLIKIATANTGRCLSRLSYSGSLLEGQRITLLNKSGVSIVLGHLSTNTAGSIRGKFYELADGEFVDLVHDSATTFFNLVNRDFRYNRWNLVRWTGDQTLSLFISSAQTYIVKINYNNANGTINSVSGFDNLSQASTTGTNWTKNGGTSVDYSGSGLGYYLTDTESAKMYNLIHTLSGYQFTITGLTVNRDYILCVYYQSYDSSARALTISDTDYAFNQIVNLGIFSTNTANANGCIATYIFRSNGGTSTQRQFTLNGSSAHVFAITCALLA